MKILVLLIALANVVLFMWEYRQGAFEQGSKAFQQTDREQIVLVSEVRNEVVDVDFTSLYPPGLDPLSDNFFTESSILEDFSATAPCVALPPASMQSTGELLLSAEPQNEAVIPTKP
jgi:hypothetical protein